MGKNPANVKVKAVELQKLEPCESLHWLIASKNKLQSDEGLENLKQLWYLDISNNEICGLSALSRYLALGTVILSNNNLRWMDLELIRHAHFLSISLHGNPLLDKDPYYRIHVIDCLPLIWELDGRLVTVTERLHVKQFFIDTELTKHPVRHKTGRAFKTTAIRNIGTEGIVSKQCKYIYSKFPMSETHTKHTDERRLRYLCNMVQGDIERWFEESHKKKVKGLTNTFLEELLEQRKRDVERCNMVLLLLVISLEFQLPTTLMKAVLGTVGLDLVGTLSTMPLFLLPRIHRTKVICVLLNAAKVDRDNNVVREIY
ncbi:protein phosphatase 1 regulatory subunit 7 [Plakobranchus ocellatus]|uniref:Protein phosphatase 1 regulatory subunit 7 n=1 Tax=Plakobranchus ocellatus TaxID=259542 RepID=A0AAV4BJ04_9GAST|nr:protein phosphatase 1 regulatory subunit 7 [Plakobranchus ocellatus]